MNRVVRQAIIFLALLLAFTIVRLPYGSYRDRLLPSLKQQASKARIGGLDAQTMDLSFPSTFTVTGLSALLPVGRIPVPLFIDSVKADFNILSLLRLAYRMNGTVSLYNGHIEFEGERGIWSSGGTIHVDARDVKLDAHPAFKLVGAQGNLGFTLDAETKKQPVTAADIDNATLKFNLSNGEVANLSTFVPLIQLPVITGIQLSGRAELKQGRVALQESKLDSSLGSARGSGSLALLADGRPGNGSMSFRVELSPDGKKSVAPYLALGAGLPVENPPANWQIDVLFKPNEKPRASIRPS